MALARAVVGMTPEGKRIVRYSDESAVNTLLAVTVGGFKGRKFLHATAKYSAAPTQAGVTAVLDSGAGAAYDTTLNTGTANAQSNAYIPVGGLMLGDTDAIVVTAPAGGGGITAAVAVYMEEN